VALTTPKLRVPIEFGTFGLRAVEQDSDDEIAACVYALIATERGSRIEEPDYGVEDPTFEALPLDLDEWLAQIDQFEPRAEVVTAQDLEAELIKIGVIETP
jgi:phage baseplate assembly protein W